ncbi:molybdopterin molybdotransferase MoeA [Spiribacter halobius]|uniref:Molybdopterin molybdenumtransferase n=1 Tax=Sediminicurvatus halobius TaxID=2182432 RepID=A0A2U2MZI5_9GAMM|nr:gephyrin-like molybdotransferase Glp [Spiribacter halobius]PWG62213.1 molybdopterin molybdenumtransferase MoeA [Spiribacter halobius]UEX78119.1 molybdopterin molybdotransferase MoeA [Spiribacter halobius]
MSERLFSAGCGHDAPAMPLAEALQRILGAVGTVAARQRLAVRSALGRVLAESVTAPADVPAQDNSAMDGYAVRGEDRGTETLRLVGSAFAGHPFSGRLGTGECVRIMTGGVIPAGADTVIMQERARAEGERVHIESWPETGDNIRPAGEDLRAGETILGPGRRLTPADIGLLASVGRVEVAVHRRPRVAFFSTGDELRGLGEPLGPGEIHDSNRYTLHAMLTRLGAEVFDYGVVADEPAALAQAFRDASAEVDAVLTSGGVSVGEADFIGRILGEQGEVDFWSIAMKPGRPLTFGRVGTAWFFGLPGNPVSVMATFSQVVAPTLRQLAGENAAPPRRFRVRCRSRLRKKPGRMEFQRGRLVPGEDGTLEVESVGHQGSGILRSMSLADCFIVLPEDAGPVAAGEDVLVEPFDTLLR